MQQIMSFAPPGVVNQLNSASEHLVAVVHGRDGIVTIRLVAAHTAPGVVDRVHQVRLLRTEKSCSTGNAVDLTVFDGAPHGRRKSVLSRDTIRQRHERVVVDSRSIADSGRMVAPGLRARATNLRRLTNFRFCAYAETRGISFSFFGLQYVCLSLCYFSSKKQTSTMVGLLSCVVSTIPKNWIPGDSVTPEAIFGLPARR